VRHCRGGGFRAAAGSLNRSQSAVSLAIRKLEPELRLAISAIIPVDPILDVLNQLVQQAPATRLTLLIENMLGTMERLDDGDVDIAISEMVEDQASYDFIALKPVELACVISPKLPLAARAAELKEVDMEGSTQVIVRDTSRRAGDTSFGVLETVTPLVVNDFTIKKASSFRAWAGDACPAIWSRTKSFQVNCWS